jgi:hypothetical protein
MYHDTMQKYRYKYHDTLFVYRYSTLSKSKENIINKKTQCFVDEYGIYFTREASFFFIFSLVLRTWLSHS